MNLTDESGRDDQSPLLLDPAAIVSARRSQRISSSVTGSSHQSSTSARESVANLSATVENSEGDEEAAAPSLRESESMLLAGHKLTHEDFAKLRTSSHDGRLPGSSRASHSSSRASFAERLLRPPTKSEAGVEMERPSTPAAPPPIVPPPAAPIGKTDL